MNWAIWKKAVGDAWLQLLICCLILVAFAWLFVWLMTQIEIGAWAVMVRAVPDFLRKLSDISVAAMVTPAGRLTILFVHPITLLVAVGWAVGRGSDSISGEIGRGTMDLILSLPVRRFTVMLAPAVVAAIGAFVLAGSLLGGIALGLASFEMSGDMTAMEFLPGTINLGCMTFCFTGITTLISSCGRNRWRTIIIAGGFYVVSFIVEVVRQFWTPGAWLKYFTFLSAYSPRSLILEPEQTGLLALPYNLTLIVLGLAAYTVAAIVLTYRDIPAAR